jgi:hypothetical protein
VFEGEGEGDEEEGARDAGGMTWIFPSSVSVRRRLFLEVV